MTRDLIRKTVRITGSQKEMCIMIPAVLMGILPEVTQEMLRDKEIRSRMITIRGAKIPMGM